jgi:hypothetical protein
MGFRCRRVVRFLAMLAVVAALSSWLALSASAKFGLRLSVSESQPQVGQPVSVVIRTGPVGSGVCRMRLVAVAPGINREHALDALVLGGYAVNGPFGTTVHRLRATPRLGFLAQMRRSSATSWRSTVRFPRVGNWQLIVPNWCAPGYASPLPAVRVITVQYGSASAFPTGWAVGGGLGAVLLVGLILGAWRHPDIPARLRHARLRLAP